MLQILSDTKIILEFERLVPALTELVTAHSYSIDLGTSVWDFAVSIRDLRQLGSSESDLRWLASKGYVNHAREVTIHGDNGREFRSTGNLTFHSKTCFVLTDIGLSFVESQIVASGSLLCRGPGENDNIPVWNSVTRQLTFGGVLVKRFKWPAANQEAVLCAFEEEEWPKRIDDPLRPETGQDSKRRLADTIKCLNRKRECNLLHFHGDGTGEGVTWEHS